MRIRKNALHYRANYMRLTTVCCALSVVRHPICTIVVCLACIPAFHALLVRRGVVRLALPGAIHQTLMWPLLHSAVAVGSLLALATFGCILFAIRLVLVPAALALCHAMLRVPPQHTELTRHSARELAIEVRAALRWHTVDEAGDSTELEGLASALEQPAQADDMARRVEQIKQKYRPQVPKE